MSLKIWVYFSYVIFMQYSFITVNMSQDKIIKGILVGSEK